ncbi:MAG TPA: hypothetical protein PKE40_01080 [Arachnia sp.]|nr:hypothetical protein [Arachnia sp.]HMT84920.1 hypothetical protein [Arachnia sp.]
MSKAVTREDVVARDLDGDLMQAIEKARAFLFLAGESGDLRRRVEALLLLARVLRHRETPAELTEAMSAATIAAQLTLLPALGADDVLRGRAELECATCLVEGGRIDEALEKAWPWRVHRTARVSGWAWLVIGKAWAAQERISAAVVAHANAVAEFQRSAQENREIGTRIRLAQALCHGGFVDQAEAVLNELQEWSASKGVRRLHVEYYLALAEVRYEQGDIDAAYRILEGEVKGRLNSCRGAEVLQARYHHLSARCVRTWGQGQEADDQDARGDRLLAGFPTGWVLETRAFSSVPSADAPVRVGSRDAAVSRDLVGEVRGLVKLVGDDKKVGQLVNLLDELQGQPDAERAEVLLLIDAGEALLAHRRDPLHAERCVRRALVRVVWLRGMELSRARAQTLLAELMAADGRAEKALPLAVEAVQTFDEQRYLMEKKPWRGKWLTQKIKPPVELAIQLAIDCGKVELASDLVIFSRAAGVRKAEGTDGTDGTAGTPGALRLLPVPRLHYIDGTTSTLGSGAECLMR